MSVGPAGELAVCLADWPDCPGSQAGPSLIHYSIMFDDLYVIGAKSYIAEAHYVAAGARCLLLALILSRSQQTVLLSCANNCKLAESFARVEPLIEYKHI